MGAVGARFEVFGKMEWAHMVVSQRQNTAENGYGPTAATSGTAAAADAGVTAAATATATSATATTAAAATTETTTGSEGVAEGGEGVRVSERQLLLSMWAKFYGISHFPLYEEAVKEESSNNNNSGNKSRYIRVGRIHLFDTHIYSLRIQTTITAFLLDANERAARQHTSAFVRVVGLGLGVWQLCEEQYALTMHCYHNVLRTVALPCVSDVEFLWFRAHCANVVAAMGNGAIVQQTEVGNNANKKYIGVTVIVIM